MIYDFWNSEHVYVNGGFDENILVKSEKPALSITVRKAASKEANKKLGSYTKHFDHVLVVYQGLYDGNDNLSFLEDFERVDSFNLACYEFVNFDQLRYIPTSITNLFIGSTKSKRLSLAFLENHSNVQELSLEGQQKDIDVVGELKNLNKFDIRSITLPSLQFLKSNTNLRDLEIRLGGTINLDILPQLTKLQYLELWLIRNLTDIDIVCEANSLQCFYFQALKHVVKGPSLKNMDSLRCVTLDQMKGITDLKWISEAPNLEMLCIGDMSHLDPNAFKVFLGHKSLKNARVLIGKKKNIEVKKILSLPDIDKPFEFIE